MTIQNPFTIMSAYFIDVEHVDPSRMDRAVHAEIPRHRETPEWRQVVTEDARCMAILCLWGMCQRTTSPDVLLSQAQIQCRLVNHYVLDAERREFEHQFRLEVLDRIDLLRI